MMSKGKPRNEDLESTWRETVVRQQQSGLTVRAFCRLEELKESAFHYWKRELERRAGELPSSAGHQETSCQGFPTLVPVTITGGSPAPIEIALPSGIAMRVSSDCDEALLRMVVRALEAS